MNYSWKDTSHVSCASRSRSGGWVLGYGDSAESNVIRNGLEKDSLHCFSSLFTSFVFLKMTCIFSTWSLMLGMVIGCTWWLHVARYLKPECPKWTNNHKFQVYVNDTYRCIMVYPCIHFCEDIASTCASLIYTITCSFFSPSILMFYLVVWVGCMALWDFLKRFVLLLGVPTKHRIPFQLYAQSHRQGVELRPEMLQTLPQEAGGVSKQI